MADPAFPHDLDRVIAADAPDRRLGQPASLVEFYLRFDRTHELPHIVESLDGRIVARFALPGDLAIFVSKDRQTLPAAYVRQFTGGQ